MNLELNEQKLKNCNDREKSVCIKIHDDAQNLSLKRRKPDGERKKRDAFPRPANGMNNATIKKRNEMWKSKLVYAARENFPST